MSRDSSRHTEGVLDAVERCQRAGVALRGEADLVDTAEDSIERNLQIIGEAATP